MNGGVPLQVSYRIKLLAFFVGAMGFLLGLHVAFSALNTLSRLDEVEAQRDQWQRPSDALEMLDLQPGNTVVDLGCGSGYFSLKISARVGRYGRVVAEDIRTEPLVFLWLRTLLGRDGNVKIVRGEWDDPHLPPRVNAVLVSNTYHELTDSRSILARVYASLIPDGRLVILDRAPHAAGAVAESGEHEISPARVASELRQAKFEIVDERDDFITRDPNGENWWMITARKP